MIIISRGKQIIFYLAIIAFGVIFFIYFYKQAIVNNPNILPENISNQPIIKPANLNIRLNIDFFQSDKFKSLRSDSLPAASFEAGRRNPFEPPQ